MNITIKRAAIIAVLVGVLLPALISGAYFARVFYYEKLNRELIRTLHHDADVAALGIKESLWSLDRETATALVDALLANSPLISVEVLDSASGRFIFREYPERRTGKVYVVDRPVQHHGMLIGRVRLESSDSRLAEEFRQQLITQAGALSLQLLFSILLILSILQHRVGLPLKHLSREASLLAKGELGAVIKPRRQDEIGEVEKQLEITRRSLQNLFLTLEQKNQALETDLQERFRVESTLRDREQRLRTLVVQNPLAVIEFDLGWHILDWNEAASRIFGWHREEVLGRSVLMLRETIDDQHQTSLPLTEKHQEKQINRRADGNDITCQWYCGVIQDQHGKAQRIVAMVEDISERQRTEDEIRKLATVVQMTANLVVLTDADGLILWFNQAFEARSMKPGSTPLGKSLIGLLSGHSKQILDLRLVPIQDALDTGISFHCSELPCLDYQGNPYWVSVELQPIRDKYKTLQQWIVVMNDITDRHTISDALRHIARIGFSTEVQAFMTQLLTIVARGTGASGAYIALHQGGNINVCATWGDSLNGITPGLYPGNRSLANEVEIRGPFIATDNAMEIIRNDAVMSAVEHCETLIVEPLLDPHHVIAGHMALLFDTRKNTPEEAQSLAEIAASRAGVELSRQRTLDALQQSEKRFSLIFQSSPIPLALFRRADKQCIDLNPAFRAAFGCIGTLPWEHTSTAGGEEYQKWLADVLSSNEEFVSSDLPLLAGDGDKRECQFIARKISINNESSELVAIIDFTELLAAQRQIEELNQSLEIRVRERTQDLAETNAELKQTLIRLRTTLDELVRSEKLAALGSLVAGISHELNTPIGNSLIVASTLSETNQEFSQQIKTGLRKSSLEAYVKEMESAADILVNNLHRASELISSFKQVAADRTSSQRRKFKLTEIVDETILTMRPVFKKTPYEITQHIPEDLVLDSYPGPLGQVISNLLNNTILHAFDGRQDGRVSLEAKRLDSNHISLIVQDNGIGIPAANLSRIFDPFFTTKLGQDGTGLGLNIVHTITTDILGGGVKVESNEGAGTAFVITLPTVAPEA